MLVVETLPVMLSTVPGAAVQLTWTLSVKLTDPPDAKSGVVQLAVPVPPTAGVEQVQPAGDASDWKVVFAGIGNEATESIAVSGPPFVTAKT